MNKRRSGLSERGAWIIVAGVVGLVAAGTGLLIQMNPLPAQKSATSPSGETPLVAMVEMPDGTLAPWTPELAARAAAAGPAWFEPPFADYPKAAADAGVTDGWAKLKCDVQPDGRLGTCQILSETPTGLGIGAAAVEGARKARVNPSRMDELPGGYIIFSTRFRP